jgi:hypothetical protein
MAYNPEKSTIGVSKDNMSLIGIIELLFKRGIGSNVIRNHTYSHSDRSADGYQRHAKEIL